MTVGNFDALPPDLRFYAGGDRSMRGFDYHEIGEVNANGNVIGGKYLAIASAEYEYYFNEDWGAASSSTRAMPSAHDFSLNVGAGVGVRWRSPLGPDPRGLRVSGASPNCRTRTPGACTCYWGRTCEARWRKWSACGRWRALLVARAGLDSRRWLLFTTSGARWVAGTVTAALRAAGPVRTHRRHHRGRAHHHGFPLRRRRGLDTHPHPSR